MSTRCDVSSPPAAIPRSLENESAHHFNTQEIKAHAWSYADIYKKPKMAKRIAEDIADELLAELRIARKCGKKFKVGVRDPGLKAAIKEILPGLKIEVLKC